MAPEGDDGGCQQAVGTMGKVGGGISSHSEEVGTRGAGRTSCTVERGNGFRGRTGEIRHRPGLLTNPVPVTVPAGCPVARAPLPWAPERTLLGLHASYRHMPCTLGRF